MHVPAIRCRSVSRAGLSLVALLHLANPASAQQKSGAPPAAEVTLQATSVFPGGELTIPIELKSARSRSAGSLAFSVRVPEGMTFKGGALAFGLESENGSIAAAPVTGGGDRVSVIVKGEKKPLPDGVLAYLTFSVPRDAPLGTRAMEASDAVVKGPGGDLVEPVTLTVGEASIVDPLAVPVIACFFYMH